MSTQPGVGQALAELVRRLTPEEKREFVRWSSWKELDLLHQEERVSPSAAETAPRAGEPRVYVGTTSDGLALELPVASVPAFVKQLPVILSAPSVEVYVRKGGRTEEFRVRGEGFTDFVNTHLDTLQEESVMLELDGATLVSGGGGCMLLTLSEANKEMRSRLATEALRACGFDYEFTEDRFIATVWNDALEVSER